jgi:hypothetical protein
MFTFGFFIVENFAAKTHPLFASLDHPFFAFGGKRVFFFIPSLTVFPACGRGGSTSVA